MSDDSLGLMSSDQLRTYQCEIAEEMAAIKKQLEAADYDRKVNGKWADKSWYGKARWALRHRQIEYNRTSGALSAKLKEERAARRDEQLALSKEAAEARAKRQDILSGLFVDVAREMLDDDTFKKILFTAMEKGKGMETDGN